MTRKILLGDVFEKIKEIPDETVDVVCTSPPYWGLRDYGVEGQMGMEPDFHDYLAKLNTLMRELRRVLKKTGTVWVNLGDTYSTVSGGMKDIAKGNTKQYGKIQYLDKGTENKEVYGIDQTNMKKGLKPKCRVGIPERFYINCIDDGWIARNHIVWTKNNAMPSSVKDRFTNKWESVFFFAKEKKYYFNLDVVREECITKPKPFNVRVRDSNNARFLQKATDEEKANHNKKGEKEYRPGTDLKQNYDGSKYDNQMEEGLHRQGLYKGKYADSKDVNHPLGKNPGDIFLINTKPYKGAHFAVFPAALPEKILKCSCPKDGLVLDPFLGSGTTAWVAQQLNLNWIGIELNEEYAKIAKDRLGLNNSLGEYL